MCLTLFSCCCFFHFALCLPSPQSPSSPPLAVRYWLARTPPAVWRRRRRSQLAAAPGTPGLPQRRRRRRSWLAKRAEHFIYSYTGNVEFGCTLHVVTPNTGVSSASISAGLYTALKCKITPSKVTYEFSASVIRTG